MALLEGYLGILKNRQEINNTFICILRLVKVYIHSQAS